MDYKVWTKTLNRLNHKISAVANNLSLLVLATRNVGLQEVQAQRIQRLQAFKRYLLMDVKVIH